MSTVEQILHHIFPRRDGEPAPYIAFPGQGGATKGAKSDVYAMPPMLPFDVFAITGKLLELSGAYHHIAPRHRDLKEPLLHVSSKNIRKAKKVAAIWREMEGLTYMKPGEAASYQAWHAENAKAIKPLFKWWTKLFKRHGRRYVVEPISSDGALPKWWGPALLLFIAADEAAEGVGFKAATGLPSNKSKDAPPWFEHFINLMFLFVGRTMDFEHGPSLETAGISTYSAAEKSFVCVLPKARTPSLGCTMRSLSQNLALMPPQGIATGWWMPYLFKNAPPDERHMNLLLVPFPFSISASAFVPSGTDDTQSQRSGFFRVKQQWLYEINAELLTDFVVALAHEAGKEVDQIHAVVFPELALNEPLYDELVVKLQGRLKGIEFLVAGVSSLGKRRGNFVNVTVFQGLADQNARSRIIGFTSKREKHHRWRLDRSQIIGYGLEGVLSPSLFWWEDIDLMSRRVDFSVIRKGSVISALICEDLARVDPCQELIRAVGPSIVFALLMDAPQLKERWPARHATILAEDPGCAVLTMTSKALMNRQDRLGLHSSQDDKDRVIALWRDDGDPSPREIQCGKGCCGVLLTLSGRRVEDESLDGRIDPHAVAWRFASQRPLRLDHRATEFAAVLGAQQPAY